MRDGARSMGERRPAPLHAVLLAAGFGSRMRAPSGEAAWPASKLLLPFRGGTVVGTALGALVTSGVFDRIVVVTGHAAESVEAAVCSAHPGVRCVRTPDAAAGMGTSIAAGVAALPPGAVAVALGDLPLVRPKTLRRLGEALGAPDAVVRPAFDGQPGHPVLFGASHRKALLVSGAAQRIARAARPLEVLDAGVVTDVDTPEAYRRALDVAATR